MKRQVTGGLLELLKQLKIGNVRAQPSVKHLFIIYTFSFWKMEHLH